MPALLKNNAVKSGFRSYVAPGLFNRAFGRARHVGGIKILNNNGSVSLGNSAGLHMIKVLTNAGSFCLSRSQEGAGFQAPVRASLTPCKNTGLLTRSSIKKAKPFRRYISERTIRQSQSASNAAINAYGWFAVFCNSMFKLTSKADMPTQSITAHSDVADVSLNGSCPAEAHPPYFGEPDTSPIAVQAFNSYLTPMESKGIMNAALSQIGIARTSRKKIRIGSIKVAQSLLLASCANFSDELKLAPKLRQFAALAWHRYGFAIDAVKRSPMVAALFKSQIIDQPNNTSELREQDVLFVTRIEPVSKGAVHFGQTGHAEILSLFSPYFNKNRAAK